MDEFNLGDSVKNALERAMLDRGHVNVLIAGRTGVGKSTLINAVFQGDYATTGQGRPVTTGTREINKPGIPLTILDTRGLEMGEFGTTLGELRKLLSQRRQELDARRHIHVAWICVAEDLRRVEEAESALAETLAEYVPTLAVVTKARNDQGFRAEVQRLLPQAKNVLRVRSLREEMDDGHVLQPSGLVDLVQATADLVPEGQRRAFVAVQKADMSLKQKNSHMIVATSVTAAVAVAYTPIPFSDAVLLIPIQLGMLAAITAIYGLSVSEGFLGTLLATAVGGAATTFSGRAIVTGLLKFIPGGGALVGGTIAAATAAALTTALGEGYIGILDKLFEKHRGDPPSTDEILQAMNVVKKAW